MFAKKHSAKILQQIVRRTGLPMPIRVGPRKRHHKNAVKKEKKRKKVFWGSIGMFFQFLQREAGKYATPCLRIMQFPLTRFPLKYADFWPIYANVGKFHVSCVNTVPLSRILHNTFFFLRTKMSVVRRKYFLVGTFAH